MINTINTFQFQLPSARGWSIEPDMQDVTEFPPLPFKENGICNPVCPKAGAPLLCGVQPVLFERNG